MTFLQKYKPGVPPRTLLFIAACVWGAASIVLGVRAFLLLADLMTPGPVVGALAGGLLFHLILFRRIASRHTIRIRSASQMRPCAFSFLDWRGYGMMSLMIGMGIGLRVSGILPPHILGFLYIGMSVPLLLSSVWFLYHGVNFAPAFTPDA